MTAHGDTRRAILGEEVAAAARSAGRNAPPPTAALLAELSVLMNRPLVASPQPDSDTTAPAA